MDVKMMLASLAGQPKSSQSTPGGHGTASQFSLSLAGSAGQSATPKATPHAGTAAESPQPIGQAIQEALLQRLAWHASQQGSADVELPDGQGTAPSDPLPLETLLERAGWHNNLESLAELERPDGKDAAPSEPLPLDALVERLAQPVSLEGVAERDLPDGRETAAAAPLTLEAILERLALIQGMQEAERPLTLAGQAYQPDQPDRIDLPGDLRDTADSRSIDDARQDMPPADSFMTVPITPPIQGAGQDADVARQDTARTVPSMPWEYLRSDAARGQGQSGTLSTTTADSALRQGVMNQLDVRGDAPIQRLEVSTAAAAAPAPATPSTEASQRAMGSPDTATLAAATPGTSGTAQPATSQASLSSPLQSQAWPTQLGQQLVQFARLGGEQRIEMQLHPAELGPLSVTLKMTEQGAQAQFLSAHAQVRQVLEQAIPQLREALAEQGIELSDTSVGEQRQQDAQAFAERNTQGRQTSGGDGDDTLIDADGLEHQAVDTGISLDGRVNLYA